MKKKTLSWHDWLDYPFHEAHWLNQPLPMETIRKIKSFIDKDYKVFKYKYCITGTWRPNRIAEMHKVIEEVEGKEMNLAEIRPFFDRFREGQVQRLFVDVAQSPQGKKKLKPHLRSWSVLSPVAAPEHFHAHVESTVPLRKASFTQHWDNGMMGTFKKYNPKYGELLKGDPDHNYLTYMFRKHHPIVNKHLIFHPNRRSCRSGSCEICQKQKTQNVFLHQHNPQN